MLCDLPPGASDETVDPSVSVGPDGRWYMSRLGLDGLPAPGLPSFGSVYVTSSADGYRWSPLAARLPDLGDDDFDTITADPVVAGRAYATASSYPLRQVVTGAPRQNRIVLSITKDGGRAFSPTVTIHKSPRGYLDVVSRLVVLGDGSLLDVFAETPSNIFFTRTGPFALYATRSNDRGATWTVPVRAGAGTFADIVDPARGTTYDRPCCVFSLAAGSGASASIAWTTRSTTTAGDVHIAYSTDGGRTWPVATDLQRPGQPFQSAVAITGHSEAVAWYDFSGAQPANQSRPTTLWVARSDDGGANWSVSRLAGPFDMSTAAPSGGNYLGDFQSLVPNGSGFEAAFTLARPFASNGATDIFATSVP
jgi:hypothetical protein